MLCWGLSFGVVCVGDHEYVLGDLGYGIYSGNTSLRLCRITVFDGASGCLKWFLSSPHNACRGLKRFFYVEG